MLAFNQSAWFYAYIQLLLSACNYAKCIRVDWRKNGGNIFEYLKFENFKRKIYPNNNNIK